VPCYGTLETNYKTFHSTIRNTPDSIVRSKVRGSTGNRILMDCKNTKTIGTNEMYRQHKRGFEFFNKFLYNQYICEVEHS